MEMVVGLMSMALPTATPKFPVIPPVIDPGDTTVFVAVAAVMFPVFTVTTPPFPARNVNCPEATVVGAAYAGLSAVDASNSVPSPAAPMKLVLTLLIFTLSSWHITSLYVKDASTVPSRLRGADALFFNRLRELPRVRRA
jgi:hypothetical protein